MAGDIRDQLAQIRSILDDIDRDLPPRALKGQEDYDAIVEIGYRPCPRPLNCEECAFDILGEVCPKPRIRALLSKARGGRSE